MGPLALWFVTVLLSVVIISLFIAAYLDNKWRDIVQQAGRDNRALRESVDYWQDQTRQSNQRYALLRSTQWNDGTGE